MHHADELLEHLLGYREIGDDAVFHGTDGFNVAWHPAQHLLGFTADRLDDFLAAGAALVAYGHNGRLVQDDSFAANVNKGIGGPEIDRHIAGEVTTKESEHGRPVWCQLLKKSVGSVRHQAQTRGAEVYQRIKPTMITYN
jgi:hypothetical protein